MRSHKDILLEAGVETLHSQLPVKPSLHTVRSWATRDSIPAEWWAPIVALQIATLEELAEAAARKRKLKAA